MGMRKGSVRSVCVLLTLFTGVAGVWADTPTPPAQPTPPTNTPAATKTPAQATSDADYSYNENGATAKCRDGTYYHGRPNQSACREHRGVEKWAEMHGDR